MKCLSKSKLPYPEIKIEEKNEYYANLLFEDYAGKTSETTAIFLYTFQHIIKENKHENIAKILKEISITEMRHLEMLGETISLLGCNPVFKSNSNNFWNASNVNYSYNLKDMLIIDIVSEQKAINQYIKHKNTINDKYIKNMINRILDDEFDHLECFKYLYSTLK